MQFAAPIPWWLAALVAAALAALASYSYRRPLAPLSPVQRGVLTTLRLLSLGAVLFFVERPVVLVPPARTDAVIPILVDLSRSMRIPDADLEPRIERAARLVQTALLPELSKRATVELLGMGDTLVPVTADSLQATGHRSDLAAAVAAVRDRYRGRSLAGIIVLSDGGATAPPESTPSAQGAPIFTVGIGSADGVPDRELIALTAGDPRLDQASIDLRVSAATRGFGRTPFQLRVLGNGQLLETRTVTPAADGAAIDETFTVLPDPQHATVYTAEITAGPGESVTENNARTVLASPAGRKRRVLVIAGAPGYDHSFLMRALAEDPGLELDSIVRKGKNEEAADTFLVQAGGGRAAGLITGFPASREALYAYDALIVANLEGEFFTRAQLAQAADFVGARGGGLLLFGGKSFEQRGLINTPLEEALPVELNDRRGSRLKPPTDEAPALRNMIVLTPEGQTHPVMRIGASIEASLKLWAGLPALASSAAVGGPRPGATVLAVTSTASGAVLPIVAVQRYGRGRSMVFAGEGSWRWRMLRPSTDRSYEFFWRQALRWLSSDAPDPVTVTVPAQGAAGEALTIDVDARDAAFLPARAATVEVTVTPPGGVATAAAVRPTGPGHFATTVMADVAGLYHVQAQALQGTTRLGDADRWLQVGGNDPEFADPRLNEGVLRRLALESGGRYVRASDAASLVPDLLSAIPQGAAPVRRDLWHESWAFALVLALLSAEWILRRRWGLR